MTNREFYQAIIDGSYNDELTAYATEAIAKLDHTNELRKASAAKKAAEKAAEKAPIREAIVNVITKTPQTATSLIAAAGVELKPQAIPSLLKSLIEDGTVVKSEIKVQGKGKQVGYALA